METYDAFISYSHARDRRIAAALQAVLQKFGHAEAKRTLKVFRDDTGLGAASTLWSTIEEALTQSRYFVLLASPDAAQSEWVDREVAWWRQHKGVATLLIGVTAGELRWSKNAGDFIWDAHTPLPPALKAAFAAEPKWVELGAFRWAGLRQFPLWRNGPFIAAAANFGAPISGMPKEQLAGHEMRQQRRDKRRRRLVTAALVVVALVAFWQWREAARYRFYLESPFGGLASTPASQPSSDPAKAPNVKAVENPIILSLAANRTLWLGNRQIEREQLQAELDALTHGDRSQPVHVRADRSLSYDDLSVVLGALTSAGYRQVRLVVQAAEEK